MLIPTQQTYDELQYAYGYLNDNLFGGQLPDCLITLQRKRHTMGYFSPKRFVNREGTLTDEIAINPKYFAATPIRDTLSTIAHEMAHLWQHHFGNPGRGRYHNREWANKMADIGLQPTDTGGPGGKITGDMMSDFIIAGGRFDLVTRELLAQDYIISWLDRLAVLDLSFIDSDKLEEITGLGVVVDGSDSDSNKSNRVKYSHKCNEGIVNVWGRPGLSLLCGVCDCAFDPS